MKTNLSLAAIALSLAAAPAFAAAPGAPVKINDDLTIDPIVEGRLRWESVDQPDLGRDADAVTLRVRAGAELKLHNLSLLAEGEGVLSIADGYNAFPFANGASSQYRPGRSVVPDPETIGLNRLQIAYKVKGTGVTIGRQRINLDDQRWVGSVGWRQDEQTFDAVRGEAKIGPVALDATWSWNQRTIFGSEAGRRQAYGGDFFLGGAEVKAGPLAVKGFAYLLDYDDPLQIAASSKTYGARATGAFPLGKAAKLDLTASYARQWDWKTTARNYAADYLTGEAGVTVKGLRLAGGYEKLGADNGFSLQTPLATLHKFNGTADVFLTTPPAGLVDAYASASYKFGDLGTLKGVNANVTWHQFDSDAGDIEYGHEWDAQIGFKLHQFAVLAKYARYDAVSYPASGDVEKFWLQVEFAY
ncbi:alginate export family protein [Novosphingobium sp. BL-52-GroH]|uniref:alginate export family protein n=1 Tax=Novosphingobium sp. BL-52-GroH TaxID=3349877 RepID=UPI00384C7A09